MDASMNSRICDKCKHCRKCINGRVCEIINEYVEYRTITKCKDYGEH